MECKQFFILFLLIINIYSSQVSGYTNAIGIEEGDKVNLDYVLSYDDKVQETGPGFEPYVTPEGLIVGFYEGLLGMKIGDIKEIIVPIGEGYPPSHKLGDKILYFDVTINSILENVRGDSYIAPILDLTPFEFGLEEDTGSVFEELFTSPIFLAISLTVIIGFVYIKSTGSSSTAEVSNAKKSTKLTAKERLQKRMEEVDQSDFE